MSSAAAAASRRWIAVALAWLFPGLGHFYLGKKRTALVYRRRGHRDVPARPVVPGPALLRRAGPAAVDPRDVRGDGAGLLNLAARLLSDNPGGAVLSVTYEYGCAYLLTAGLMNLLLMLDAYDIAVGRKA